MWCSTLHFKEKIKIFIYVKILFNLFWHLQLVNFSSLCVILMYVLPKLFSLPRVLNFHEQEGRMGSCVKEKGTHLHLSQGKCFQCNIEKILISEINSLCVYDDSISCKQSKVIV